jgi:sugar O-acyltransferase (sialic acid O-acetyltransferase NeuD family)
MISNKLIILGTGGSSLDIIDVVDSLNAAGEAWETVGFLDDGKKTGSQHRGLPILGSLSDAQQHRNYLFINSIGSDRNYKSRAAIIANCGLDNQSFATLVHPNASVSPRARLGVGVCVNYGVSIGGGAVVGDHVYICPGAIIGHDTIIGAYSIIAPGAIISGFVEIGSSCYIGAGAAIRQSLRIGDCSLVGMGAVVVRNVQSGVTVIGTPAEVYCRH